MNILIVKAHPSSQGYTHRIASTYADAKRSQGHTVEIVDLYTKEYAIEPFRFEKLKEYKVLPLQKKFHDQLLWAHEIVVVHPIWWGTVPSVMKNWVDVTFWPHIAYQYTSTGKIEKLLEGKGAKIFATSGGPSWYYRFPFLPFRSFWVTTVFEFCGVDVASIKVCGKLDIILDEAKREKHFQKFLKEISKS